MLLNFYITRYPSTAFIDKSNIVIVLIITLLFLLILLLKDICKSYKLKAENKFLSNKKNPEIKEQDKDSNDRDLYGGN